MRILHLDCEIRMDPSLSLDSRKAGSVTDASSFGWEVWVPLLSRLTCLVRPRTRAARRLLKSRSSLTMTKHHPHDDNHDLGLKHDLSVLAAFAARRRAVLKWGLGLGALPLLACAGTEGSNDASESMAGAGNDTGTGDGSCSVIPEETAGPYPGDGTNGQNALTLSGIVRSDIRASIAGASGVAEGVLLTVTLTLLDGRNDCKPLSEHAIYLWHRDRAGNYSMYSTAVVDENYLRGVQETDANGQLTFTTIFPGCYSGRWPHIHFEVYPSLSVASSGENKVATSQLALPEDACVETYATDGYEASVSNLGNITLDSDNVFGDGAELQVASISGSASAGFTAKLTVTI
jgi:protocatechuate 3,4-dioxygenase beta subunit